MSFIYMGVPTDVSGGSTLPEDGVYLRMGTYVDDGSVDEEGIAPSEFLNDFGISDSEGILISSAGTYIVKNNDLAYQEFQNGIVQSVNGDDGTVTMTLKQEDDTYKADADIDVTDGDIRIEGKKSFLVKSDLSDDEDGINIKAENAKLTETAKVIKKYTSSSYKSYVYKDYTKGYQNVKLTTAVSLVCTHSSGAIVSAKVASISEKLFATSVKGLKISSGLTSLGIVGTARSYQLEDQKRAFFYVKYRGVQLDAKTVGLKTAALDSKLCAGRVCQALAKASVSDMKAVFGLKSKIPV